MQRKLQVVGSMMDFFLSFEPGRLGKMGDLRRGGELDFQDSEFQVEAGCATRELRLVISILG